MWFGNLKTTELWLFAFCMKTWLLYYGYTYFSLLSIFGRRLLNEVIRLYYICLAWNSLP